MSGSPLPAANLAPGVVHIVDDEEQIRETLSSLLRSMNYEVMLYGSAAEFLEATLPDRLGCIVLDVRLPGTNGLDLQNSLVAAGIHLPVILMTAYGDIQMTVQGMKAGALDFLTKPMRDQDLLDAVAHAIAIDQRRREDHAETTNYLDRRATLTPRERQVMDLVTTGLQNKQIAAKLDIQTVTVQLHRAAVMRKMGAKSIIELGRIAEILDSRPSLT